MKNIFSCICLLLAFGVHAQTDHGYQLPPKDIADLLLAKPTPVVSIDDRAEWMLLAERNPFPSVEELGQPELRLAGLRLNPANFSPSRQTYVNNLKLKSIQTGREFNIHGLPAKLQATATSWSPTGKKIAFLQHNDTRVDLYIIDVATQKATRINKQPVNASLGAAYSWLNDGTVLYKATMQLPAAAPKKAITPKGPTIQENSGKAAPSATFQDMIRSPYDEELFAFYTTSQLMMHRGGVETKIGTPGILVSFSVSPDKNYLLTRTIQKPYSYLVPAFGFPSVVRVTDLQGKTVKQLAVLPSSEGTPSGYDNTQNVPRGFSWRDDVAATIVWAQPLDSGLIAKKVPHHDVVYALAAPFNGTPKELFRTTHRFRNVTWGNATLALVDEGLRSRQRVRTSRFNPATGALDSLFELAQTDAYNNPGSPVVQKNAFGRNVLVTLDNGSKLLFNNTTGSTARGDLPFLSRYDLEGRKSEIIWRSKEGTYEYISDVVSTQPLVVLTRRETQKLVPNFYLKNLSAQTERALTTFTNPYPQLEGVTKQKVFYKRADGIDLTGDLYLPKGYNKEKDGPLPVVVWAYPREFNNAADAAQVRGSQDRFLSISSGSPVFYVTQGYAVLDNAEMPIVSKDGKKPNDTFVEQLKLNAEAAINKLADMGVGDRNRVAVGGHSYGAFMTANLLAHTNLFKAGIARSGAYNRTLTPFGFQNEDRTYWQAPELYHEMSPFSYADKIKTPLLLVHGELDDNTGTYPINSERLYNAIKGHGGTVRFVYLPYEAHGYRGKENLLHLLWEQYNWLEKHVKGVPKGAGEKSF